MNTNFPDMESSLHNSDQVPTNYKIAVIGMAGRFPGAKNVDTFWHNLRNGVESIKFFTDEELTRAGVPSALLKNPDFVKAYPALDEMESFDAGFFGLSPRDASIMDPQHRQFLECAWEALEHAGCDPETYPGTIGVFAGSGRVSYLTYHLLPNSALMESVGEFLLRHTGNDKDFLATRVSYEFNLKGPSLNVQTACSTSLVAIHLACQSLLMGECDTALAGGVTILLPQDQGYVYREGEVLSPDGHCRAFSADAKGTVFGNGAGVVVLKRLEDAMRDGDSIMAIIRGSAINNDGSMKGGYLAPSVSGQAEVVAAAMAVAGVDAESISYVEMHGTGTPVGDPIEVTALTQAFRKSTDKTQFCGIGSVKTNIGHVDTAAGTASFIKTVLALRNRQIPANLHFEAPNTEIDFVNSPFFVNSKLTDWKAGETPRRAGVNSLGIGGTNAHLILEEAPEALPSGSSRPQQLLVLSAKTDTALENATKNLIGYLKENPQLKLADVAFTLQTGRKRFNHRRLVVSENVEDAIKALEEADPKRVFTSTTEHKGRPVAFMFTGQGAQYVNMGRELYELEPAFRETVDRCSKLLQAHLGQDLRTILFPSPELADWASTQIHQTAITQPALFVIEYALAMLWMQWGLQPQAMIGHSIGEYVAACLAKVFSLEDALTLVAARGRLMQEQPGGAMIAVPLSEARLLPYLNERISLAAINGPELCVLSGPFEAIKSVEKQLEEKDIAVHRLHTSHAFHSAMMEPMLKPFAEKIRKIRLQLPQIPFLSNVTGTWITEEEATDPGYWLRHAREAVRFSEGLQTLLQESDQVLVEVGPGRTLSRLTMRHPAKNIDQIVLTSLRHPEDQHSDLTFLLQSLGRAWAAGVNVDWTGFYARERRSRVCLPTYPFEHQRYWIERGELSFASEAGRNGLSKKTDLTDWFYQPSWKRSPLPLPTGAAATKKCCWLIFEDQSGLGTRFRQQLEASAKESMAEQVKASEVVSVRIGGRFWKMSDNLFIIDPHKPADYWRLLKELTEAGRVPERIVHLWNASPDEDNSAQPVLNQRTSNYSFHSLLFLAQAIGQVGWTHPMQLAIISQGMQALAGESVRQPAKALLLGPCKVIPREFPNLLCRSIDVMLPEPGSQEEQRLLRQIELEFDAVPEDRVVAYRGSGRWVQTYEAVRLEGVTEKTSTSQAAPSAEQVVRPISIPAIRSGGVYLITGGLGGLGLEMAGHLAKKAPVKLVLVGRTGLPRREDWESTLTSTDPGSKVHRTIKQLQALEASGAEVMVAAADVSKREEMQPVLEKVWQRFGAIHGVIHAAGVLNDCLIQMKTPDGAERVFAPKVTATLLLEELLANTKLDFLLLCSSVSALAGVPGQVDYCAANAFLDAFAQWKTAKDGTWTVAINWGAWQEVGMAAELAARANSDQSLPDGLSRHPLLAGHVTSNPEQPEEKVFSNELSIQRYWVLSEHKFQGGEAVIPGTTYLEMARAAFQKYNEGGPVELRDVLFIAPLEIRPSETKPVRLRLKQGNDASEFVIESRRGMDWQEHARGAVAQFDPGKPHRVSLPDILSQCNREEKIFTGPRPETREDRYFFLGQRWNSLKRIHFGTDQAVAYMELPEQFLADLNVFKMHPAMLDWATSFALHLVEGYEQSELMYIPFSYKRLRLHAPLPGRIYSHARCLEPSNSAMPTFHLTITDPDGVVIVEVEEFSMKGIQPMDHDKRRANLERSAGAPALQFDLSEAISPAEGLAALDRILYQPGLPQVIVSPQDLTAWLKQFNQSSEPSGSSEKPDTAVSATANRQARPNLATAYLAPRDGLEQALVKVWEEALGLEGIGIEDNFFELGGHSLLLTQTITRMRKLLPVEISVRKLFARPSIAAIVDEIAKAPTLAPSDQAPSLVAVPRETLRARSTQKQAKPLESL
ncbi:type I polyketide synthase [Pedosphaera parvula]|nr:type I polyketide synthase [Pedosphaera parvula]